MLEEWGLSCRGFAYAVRSGGEFGDGGAREVGGVLGASGSCLFPEGLSLSPAGGPEPKVDGFPAGLIWESQLLVG